MEDKNAELTNMDLQKELEKIEDINNKLLMLADVIETANSCCSEDLSIDSDAVLKLWQTTFLQYPLVRDILRK